VNFCHKRKPINLGIVLLSCKGIPIPASFVCLFSIVAQKCHPCLVCLFGWFRRGRVGAWTGGVLTH
jgi:hypothetical protein